MQKKTYKPLKIYLAAPWVHGKKAMKLRDRLVESGYIVTSRWLNRKFKYTKKEYKKSLKGEAARTEAIEDLLDIEISDVMVLMNSAKSEGKAVETGYAIHRLMPIFILGKPSNVFHSLASVSHHPTLKGLLRRLKWFDNIRRGDT